MPTSRGLDPLQRAFLVGIGAVFLSVGVASAQTLEQAEQEIRWKLDEHGQVCVSPDPLSGGANGDWRPIGDPRTTSIWANLGVLGNLALVASGDTDTVSISDAVRFWERLGVDAEALVRRLGAPPASDASATERMQFVLAIRAVQDLGQKPAIGPLARIADAADGDAAIRRAAIEALASLRGQARSERAGPVLPLADVLGECPRDPHLLVVADQTRMPCSRPLMAWARVAGLAVTRQTIRAAGGSVSPATWAGAAMLAEGAGVLPYEIARRFGNHRITRTVAAVRLSKDRSEPEVWASFEGEFDLAALRAGLVGEGVPFTEDGDALAIPGPFGVAIRVSATRAIVTRGEQDAAPFGSADGAALATELGDMPCVVRLRSAAELLGELPIGEGFLPRFVGVRAPFSRGEPFEIALEFASGNFAGLVESEIAGLSRRVESMVYDGRLPEAILDAVEAVEVQRDDARLRVRFTLPPLDEGTIAQLVREIGG